MQPIKNNQVEPTRVKRFYPPRIYRDEAEKKAIVILRDCAGLSFGAITRIINKKDKRNTIYTYNQNKDRYSCQRGQNIIHIDDEDTNATGIL